MAYKETLSQLDKLEAQLTSEHIAFIQSQDVPKEIKHYFDHNDTAMSGWLFSTKAALGNCRPVDLLNSEEGRGQVIELILRLEHGLCA